MAKKTAPAPLTCVCCKCLLGDDPKVLPTFVVPTDAEDGARQREAWCPQDFVFIRAPQEPKRFTAGQYSAISCASCGNQSVAAGNLSCSHCGSRITLVLGPRVAVA